MRNELKEFAVVTGCISFFILLSIYNISYPGLNYDELFFTNAALGDLDGSFVGQKIWNIPLYLMEYIGASKAWLYYLIFKIFGLSVTSIRIPVIIISSFGLFLYFKICK